MDGRPSERVARVERKVGGSVGGNEVTTHERTVQIYKGERMIQICGRQNQRRQATLAALI